jgi:BirA family biotin operon repressor/biotin-[acetyl-CoA-carboxylase] ligase
MAGWLGHRRVELASCTSTSDVALAEARAGCAHGTVVVADEQTAGRGRLGRVWASPPGRHLYLSAVVRGPITARPPAERAALTLAVGVGVVDAVRAAGARAAGLKWPNDVLVSGRKLAGILCESTGDAIVIGIGVNLAGTAGELPAAIAARAITLADAIEQAEHADRSGDRALDRALDRAIDRAIDRVAFTELLLDRLEPWLDRFAADGPFAIVDAWQQRMIPGLRVTWERTAGAVSGRADGLEPDGALRLIADDGQVHRVVAGELTHAP